MNCRSFGRDSCGERELFDGEGQGIKGIRDRSEGVLRLGVNRRVKKMKLSELFASDAMMHVGSVVT